jgi:hypothetical protein
MHLPQVWVWIRWVRISIHVGFNFINPKDRLNMARRRGGVTLEGGEGTDCGPTRNPKMNMLIGMKLRFPNQKSWTFGCEEDDPLLGSRMKDKLYFLQEGYAVYWVWRENGCQFSLLFPEEKKETHRQQRGTPLEIAVLKQRRRSSTQLR